MRSHMEGQGLATRRLRSPRPLIGLRPASVSSRTIDRIFRISGMPDRLLLRLDPSGSLNWLRQAADGRMLSSAQHGIPPAAVLESPGDVVVLVPAEQVLLLRTRIHARNKAQLQQAVPFAIEDQLLGAVEDQHFAVCGDGEDQVGVAVVSRTQMKSWLDHLRAAGVRPDVLVPESLALPVEPERACALVEDTRAVVR